jgi:hypothetical protein
MNAMSEYCPKCKRLRCGGCECPDRLTERLAAIEARLADIRPEDNPIIVRGHFSTECVEEMNRQWVRFVKQTGCRRPLLIFDRKCEISGVPVYEKEDLDKVLAKDAETTPKPIKFREFT